ncbi:MAG: hypothetical protein U1D30_21900 [Planctomycetota bacterium]
MKQLWTTDAAYRYCLFSKDGRFIAQFKGGEVDVRDAVTGKV